MKHISTLLCCFLITAQAQSAQWSNTELQLAYGDLTTPDFVADKLADSVRTTVLTFQHASGWQYGDNFFFMDYLDDNNNDSFNNADFYAELYLNFSLGKMLARDMSFGPIKDVGVLAGFNLAGDAKVRKFLPGLRFSWALPGFVFLNTDVMAYQDHSVGVAGGGAPSESDSFIVDVNGLYPFTIGVQQFQLTGHIEYVDARNNEFGGEVASWVLAQPQLRWDLGHALWNVENQLFVGIEYQYWRNKLGESGTRESEAQLLIVWQL